MLWSLVQFWTVALVLFPIGVCVAEEPLVDEAVRHIRDGRSNEGASLLNDAIEGNPEHAANRYSIDGSIPVGATALAHGRKQFEQLAKDRPDILRGGKKFETMHAWAIREFAGASCGFLVDWDSRPLALPTYGSTGQHVPPRQGENAKIWIAATVTDGLGSKRRLDFEELWHHLVFECYNLRGTPAFRELDQKASHGTISRVDFVEEIFRLEHDAFQLTHSFYAAKFLPCASAAGIRSRPKYWRVTEAGWWQQPADFINTFPFHAYPWKPYGDRYDILRIRGNHAATDSTN